MRQHRNGLIINFGSLAAGLPIPFHGYLSASKAAVITFSDALRLEVKHLGIAVTVVEPGMVATHQGERFTQLKAAGVIRDYAEQEARAAAVMEQGQRAGTSPRAVAQTVLQIIRTNIPPEPAPERSPPGTLPVPSRALRGTFASGVNTDASVRWA